jgi:protein O-GlcNAc transferase
MSANLLMQRALEDARIGRLPQALASIRGLAQRKPKDHHVAQVLGLLLHQSGELEQARHQFARAVAISSDAGTRNNLGSVLLQLGRLREAAAQFERALELDPRYAPLYQGLTACRLRMGDARAAIAVAERGLTLTPHAPDLVCALMLAHDAVLALDTAIDLGIRTLSRHPLHPTLWAQTLMLMNYSTRADIEAWHRRFGGSFAQPFTPIAFDRNPARRLRIAVLSPDLRSHSVAYFALALFEHAPPDVELVALSSESTPNDPMTQRLRARTHEWHEVGALDDAALDAFIRDLRVDVLIELAGHSGGNRLTALARKPAPLIVSAIGYPNSTGLDAIDYRLCDAITDPPGSEQMIERPLRVAPCFLCYSPPRDAPEPALAPAEAPLTFGSFNALSKMSDATAQLWSRVLAALPSARLLLKAKALADPAAQSALLDRLHRHGIAPERITLAPATVTVAEHLALYRQMHVALDTIPYHGTTTTCEALWMGVPVVSLRGDCQATRVGASLLSAAGLPEWIAADADAFVAICVQLANDPKRLTDLRRALRAQLTASPLCDAPGYAARFFAALHAAWRQRCSAP